MFPENGYNIKTEEKGINDLVSDVNDKKLSDKSSVGKRFFQIDFIKTICIIIVIAGHTLDRYFPLESLWQIIQPIPLFLLIMGFNYGNSFKKRNYHKISEIYSFQYFKRAFWRLIFPLLLINLICFIIDLICVFFTGWHVNGWSSTQVSTWRNVSWGDTNIDYTPMNLFYFLIGAPYFPGPGEFYVVIAIQFILIFPLIYKLFDKNPILGLFACYTIDLGFQLIAGNVPLVSNFFDDYSFLFCGNILRYMSIIGLGIWFVNNHNLFSKKNIFIIILAIPALFLLMIVYWGDIILPESFINSEFFNSIFTSPPIVTFGYDLKIFRTYPWWGKANLFTYFFPAFIFLLLMKVLPSELNKDKPRSQSITRFFEKYSKLTYHILLVQIVYFFINIPIMNDISISINQNMYQAFIQPITEPYGIITSWQLTNNPDLLSFNASICVSLIKLFLIFINCSATFSLAIIFYNIDTGLQRNLKKIKRKKYKNFT
ncbi:MAG: acyltransferase family protein [Candidatus Lokiarchaeota archaeon]|nr:acyltransferase family protein [Candidatus Lokiarchaeota archaeon]